MPVINRASEYEVFQQEVARYLENRYGAALIEQQSFLSSARDGIQVDLVLRETRRNRPIMLVEVKIYPRVDKARLISKFQASADYLHTEDVKCYLATRNRETGKLEFHDYTPLVFGERPGQDIDFFHIKVTSQLPEVEELTGPASHEPANALSLSARCSIAACGGLAVLIVDAIGPYHVSWERLALLTFVAAMFLLPSLSKAQVAIGNVSFELERYPHQDDTDGR